MRTRLSIALIVLILTAGMHPARAQDEPGKIVEQCVKAAGGSKALGRIQTLTLEGTFTSDDGKTGTYTLDTKLPNRYYSELQFGIQRVRDRKSTRLNSSHSSISYAVFCLKKKKNMI